MVLTDILKRWQLLHGRSAVLCTGTDEHGMKIQRAADKAGTEPKLFCDAGADVFKILAEKAALSNDYFVRTTGQRHKDAVQYAWHVLKERGYLYEAKHEGWYSVSDETFYPPSQVHLIVDPPTGRKIMTSIETGKEVEWTSELNYHFRLSAFRERLLELYADNPEFIVPSTRHNDVVASVIEGLKDLSVSRPSERLTWGITVPDDPSQTIYVWLDALLNYISVAGYPWPPSSSSNEHTTGPWPADVQVIGKDIIRFHTIYWPAFLMALDLPPPKQVLTHAHWTLGRQKMAKSTGNVVNPFFAIDRFGVDVMRFYLGHDGGIKEDSDYSNYHIIERYKKSLQGGLGNLCSRVVRGKGWSVRYAVQSFAGKLRAEDLANDSQGSERQSDQTQSGELSQPADDAWMFGLLSRAPQDVNARMRELDTSGAAKAIMSIVYGCNRYLQVAEPWQYGRDPSSTEDRETVHRIIYLCAETLRLAGITLQPWMPNKAAQLLDMIGVRDDRRSWEWCRLGSDAEYGESRVEVGKGLGKVLFPPIADG